jgi:hypothetical protein
MAMRVIYHDKCFDGLASAALFARFWREHIDGSGYVDFAGARYTDHRDVETGLFRSNDGDENAIVDFKYSSDPRVTWWYDHHASAFPTLDDARHYDEHRSAQRVHDPRSVSCARLIVESLGSSYGFDAVELMPLVEWADRIDSAAFSSAAEAVELTAPALRIGLVVRSSDEPSVAATLIEDLQRAPLEDIERRPYMASRLAAALDAHRENIDAVRAAGRVDGDVLLFDLSSHPARPVDRFIPFYVFPEARYGVGLMRSGDGMKVTVAFNPWSSRERTHDIAALCEEMAARNGTEGAGGHPTIGGIPFGAGRVDVARRAMSLIAARLAEPHAE